MALAAATSARAQTNLVTNGTFQESDITLGSGQSGAGLTTGEYYGQFGEVNGTQYLQMTGWSTGTATTGGLNFIFLSPGGTYAAGTGDAGAKTNLGNGLVMNTGAPLEAPGEYNYTGLTGSNATYNNHGNTFVWGSNNASTGTGTPGTITAPPLGGNYIAADGDTASAGDSAAITQTITGLTVGQVYALKFYWAGIQQQSFTGATTESWQTSLGTTTLTTTSVSIASEGFSSWMSQTFYYKATSATETLTFLAVGTPQNDPPFSLLADVSLTIIPDYSSWFVFMGFGAACIAFEVIRRRRRLALRPA